MAAWRFRRSRVMAIVVVWVPVVTGAAQADQINPLDFASLGTLDLSAGNYVINTDSLQILDPNGPSLLLTGVADNQNGQADSFGGLPGPLGVPEIAVFTCDSINLSASANTTVTGTRALALRSHSTADIDTTLDLRGEDVLVGATQARAPAHD